MIHVPYLVAQRFLQVDQPLDLLLKGSDCHGVCHGDSERMMEGEFLLDVLEVGVPEKNTSSRMVALKGCHVKDEVIMDENNLAGGLGVLPDSLKVFECEIVV